MYSRLVIWLLLVLVPFQSFAAVGLIQCTDSGRISGHAHRVVRRVAMEMNGQVETRKELSTASSLSTPTVHGTGHHDVAKPMGESLHHHSHKSPCCCDNPIIFFPTAALAMQCERLSITVDPEPLQWKSVYLDGLKRPPRLTLS